MSDIFFIILIAIVFQYLFESSVWNGGISSLTNELWGFDKVDDYGRSCYVSSNYFEATTANFIFPVSIL